jgi:mannose-6-phosphate isomerase-like protein (cupin superfamily)
MADYRSDHSAHLVDLNAARILDVLGPTIQFLTAIADDAPCIMRGTIPPGATAPLHSHPDPETFVALSGGLEGFTTAGRWVRIEPGQTFHVPGGAKHAFRNHGVEPCVAVVVTTARLGRFFQEIGRPLGAGPPSAEAIQRFMEIALRYGHWNASPEQNAAIGISLPAAA